MHFFFWVRILPIEREPSKSEGLLPLEGIAEDFGFRSYGHTYPSKTGAVVTDQSQGVLAHLLPCEEFGGGGCKVQADLDRGGRKIKAEVDVGEQETTIGIGCYGAGIDHPGWRALWIQMEHLDQLPLRSPEFSEGLLAYAEHTQMQDLTEKCFVPLGIALQHRQTKPLLHTADPHRRPP